MLQFQGFDWLSGHAQEKASIKFNCLLLVLAKQNQQDIAIFLDCF